MLTLNIAAKLAGAAFLFFSAAASAFVRRSKDMMRLKRIEAHISFVRFVRDRIDRYLSPITEILRDCNDEIKKGILLGCDESEYFDIEGLRVLLRSGQFYSDGGKRFDSYLSSLGSSYRENEVAECDACINDFKEIQNNLQKELPRERKSKNVLTFCFAAAIVIILF